MKALTGLLLLVFAHGVSSVLHSLQYFYTASSGLTTFPEFVIVGMVDGVQFNYYDSNTQRVVLKQDWMERHTREDHDYLERNTGIYLGSQQVFKAMIGILKENFNQIGGIHIFQRMFGCEWDDEDDSTDGYDQYGYDGEDFMSLDLKTWVAAVPQAVSTTQILNEDKARLQYLKYNLTKVCVGGLKALLFYGKSTLQRTDRPRVSLLQRSPSSPVVCHATGFYPDRVVVFWRRDGQELHEQVDPGEVLPNHDGTFQVSVDLNLTAVPQEDWGRYECVVQLRGIEDISTPLDPALIRTNGEVQSGLTIPIIIGFVVLLLAAAAAVVGVLLYKKRNASGQRHKPVGSDTSSENTEGQNPAPEAQPLTTGQS
ncbi:major histocompatibility complex class I-related gene protein isoform X3 [Gadus morhua]|uniref:major histocompatibility complex class I-related gene protein isoform X3 n=1 Tax=Gadus morhua TaxID=8049 RepID=UPI0011B63366|nr:major histocompatibility complex class I-related gene protein-like isoform X3 [Gadus morhua]